MCPGIRNLGPRLAASKWADVDGLESWVSLRRVSPGRCPGLASAAPVPATRPGSRRAPEALEAVRTPFPVPKDSPCSLPGLCTDPEIVPAGGTALHPGETREGSRGSRPSGLCFLLRFSLPPSPCRPPRLPGVHRGALASPTPRPYPPDCLRGPCVLSRRRGAGPGEHERPGPPGLRR